MATALAVVLALVPDVLVAERAPAVAGAPGSGVRAAGDSPEFREWYRSLRDARPDPGRGARVDNLVLEREGGTLILSSGRIHLLEPIAGRTVGAVFVGEGRFLYAPPTAVEQKHLERFFDVDDGLDRSGTVDRRVRRAVFLFTDRTEEELAEALDFGPLSLPDDAEREVEEALEYVTDDDGWVNRYLVEALMNGTEGYFHAHVADSRDEPLVLEISPLRAEEVAFYRRSPDGGKSLQTVNQFDAPAQDESNGSPPAEAFSAVRILGYDIHSTIEGDLDYGATATASVLRLDPGRRWVPFLLYSELELESVRWGDGSDAPYHRPDESSDLWIDFSTAPSDSASLTFRYAGGLLDRDRDLWIEMRSTTLWFPVYDYRRPLPYRLTFETPDELTVAAVGELVSESTEDETVTTVWETPPVHLVTFNIGRFEERLVEEPDIPSLRVQYDEEAHRHLQGPDVASPARERGFLIRQSDMAGAVTKDLANSFRFYEDVFGPPPVDAFIASEIPYNHGRAYSGLVLLSWSTFRWTSSVGLDDLFRAHEVAHQWWGIGVRPATYHDQWLSEGFASFSALWYTARARGSLPLYLRRLSDTRAAILKRREEAAPIWLGTRVRTTEHPGDHQLMVYRKGAWVLHMLRTLLADPNTGDDSVFRKIMSDFYTTYRGREASTEQFVEVVNRHAAVPMDWFFRQWVYGSAIPTYHFSHKLDEMEDGRYKATVRVRQEDVPDDFQMIVPILVDFGDDGSAVVQVAVYGGGVETELPLLPMEPERIEFNPNESVLAETHTEEWRD